MRPSLAAALFGSMMFLSGCLSDEPIPPLPSTDEGGDVLLPPVANETYTLHIIATWDHPTLSVLIHPPGYGEPGDPSQVDPRGGRFVQAVLDSITHWQESIDAYGHESIAGQVSFEVYVLGRDVPPPDVLTAPDIRIFVPPAVGGGFAMTPTPNGPAATCEIVNFHAPVLTYNDLFLVSAHEFGHCLGLDHPVDHRPWIDLMAYDDAADGPLPELDCASNLDVLGLKESFAPAVGAQGNATVEMADLDYVKFDCAKRFLGSP